MEAIISRVEAIAIRFFLLLGWKMTNLWIFVRDTFASCPGGQAVRSDPLCTTASKILKTSCLSTTRRATRNKCHASNRCHATSNKCLTSSNKKQLGRRESKKSKRTEIKAPEECHMPKACI